MKKKLLTIAVTAAMVFSLVACGSNGGSNETKAVETSGSETAAESAVSEGDGEKTLKAGGEPLFFLDYIACGKNYPEKIADIVKVWQRAVCSLKQR